MKRDWVQIVSNMAIIVGLVVVIFELRQSHTIAEAQLTNEDYGTIRGHYSALMGDNAADALAKAKAAPDKLTDAERIVVDAHLLSLYVQLGAYEFIADTTGFYEDWQEVVPVMYKREFNFPYARDWWLRERALAKPWSSDLDRMLDDHFGAEAE
jgi:hypothetical protein